MRDLTCRRRSYHTPRAFLSNNSTIPTWLSLQPILLPIVWQNTKSPISTFIPLSRNLKIVWRNFLNPQLFRGLKTIAKISNFFLAIQRVYLVQPITLRITGTYLPGMEGGEGVRPLRFAWLCRIAYLLSCFSTLT